MKTVKNNNRIFALLTAALLFVSLLATPAAAATCPDDTPDQPISLDQGLVVTERGITDREFVHVVIDGGLVVTMDVATWRILSDNDPQHPGYLWNYDSVFTLWQVQRAVEWVDRNLYPTDDGGLGFVLTDPHDPDFRNVHVATSVADRLPLAEVFQLATGETVVTTPVNTVTLHVYYADGTTGVSIIEIAQIATPAD